MASPRADLGEDDPLDVELSQNNNNTSKPRGDAGKQARVPTGCHGTLPSGHWGMDGGPGWTSQESCDATVVLQNPKWFNRPLMEMARPMEVKALVYSFFTSHLRAHSCSGAGTFFNRPNVPCFISHTQCCLCQVKDSSCCNSGNSSPFNCVVTIWFKQIPFAHPRTLCAAPVHQ